MTCAQVGKGGVMTCTRGEGGVMTCVRGEGGVMTCAQGGGTHVTLPSMHLDLPLCCLLTN